MSLGLEALLEAAQFLEQQEKLKLSPQPVVPAISINEQRYFVQRPNGNCDNVVVAATTTMAGVGHNNNTIVSGSGKNLRMRHFNSVSSLTSSSSPASGTTFHHTNGLTITSCSSISTSTNNNNSNNNSSNSQLIGTTNGINNYEYRNGNSVNVTGTAQQSGKTASCGRSSEGNLIEDQFSSNVTITNKKFTTSSKIISSKTNSLNSSSDSLVMTRIKSSSEQSSQLQQHEQKQQQQPQQHQITFAPTVTQKLSQSLQLQQIQQQPQQIQHNNKVKSTAELFTPADGNISQVSAAASKQMLLNGGIRIASPAASIGIIVKSNNSSSSSNNNNSNSNTSVIAPKGITLSPNELLPHQQQQQQKQQRQHEQHHQQLSHTSVLSTSSSYPIYTTPNSNASHALNLHRHKKCNPLTPPPMPSKRFVETNTRIRSFSLSSNKFTVGTVGSTANSTNTTTGSSSLHQHQMLLQQAPEDSHISYVSSGSSNTSPSRHHQLNGSGSHYIQMMSSASASQGAQATPLIGGGGRRRTISSNSNGAGTREVHNKLEKNRRAHLKECYEQLKNQLQLRDEDRKKTSNLAILGEAYKHVIALKRKDEELEAQVEQLAKEKINAQKRIVSLKRELGPKFEQYFGNIIPDDFSGSIPVERENLNDSSSLSSSGRGSLLYSSSSSLSSGGSSNSNTVSSPIGAGLQTALPTALSPVISQNMSSSYSGSSSCIITTTPTLTTATTSPISPTLLLQQIKSEIKSETSSMENSPLGNSNSSHGSPINSPTTISGVANMPLSLTAKNISATSLTRGSPTPTPSPSPPSSSGVSSSSSIMSSSPPSMNGVVYGRNVTVNIPNGLKFQTTTGNTILGTFSNGGVTTIIGSQAVASTPIAQPSAITNGSTNATTAANAKITANTTTTITSITDRNNSQARKISLAIEANRKIGDGSFKNVLQDGEQPAKVIKVFDNNSKYLSMTSLTPNPTTNHDALQQSSISNMLSVTGTNISKINKNALALSSTTTTTTAVATAASGVAEATTTTITAGNKDDGCGFMSQGQSRRHSPGSGREICLQPNQFGQMFGSGIVPGNNVAAAFFHANGKIMFLNGGNVTKAASGDGSGCSNRTILFKAATADPYNSTYSVNDGNTVRLTPATASTATLHFTSLTPLVAGNADTTAVNNGNFAQLLAAAKTVAGTSVERHNSKVST